MKFAYSLRFVLPRITAPAAFRFAATVESSGGIECSSGIEPAVVGIPATSMLSLSRTGIPSMASSGWPARRRASAASASAIAAGFSARTALRPGPCVLSAAIRFR